MSNVNQETGSNGITINAAVEEVNWWVDLFIGLLDKGEWKVLLTTLAITFALTYILKIVYFSVVMEKAKNPNHIRLIAIISGFIAAKLMWKNDAISMEWGTAAIMVGPLSILLHHAIEGTSKMKIVKKYAPWLYPLIKGQPEKRKSKR